MRGSSVNGEPDADGPDDTTADDLFQDLAETERGLGESADGEDIYDELAEESPEEIIAAADEAAEDHPVDDAILPDEDALDDLLLSDRTMEEGFLWVDTGVEETGDEAAEADGVVDEWVDAFAAASEVGPVEEPPDEGAPATEPDDEEEDDDSTPEVTIDVPDPDEGAAAEATGETAGEERSDPTDPDESDPDDATDHSDEEMFGVDLHGNAMAPTLEADAAEESAEADPAPADGEAAADAGDEDDTTEDEADDAAEAETDDADEDSPGLLRRLLSTLSPF